MLLRRLVGIGGLAALLALCAAPALGKRITGTSGSDTIVGTKNADRVNARGGNDRVKGRAGADRLKGSKGKDRLTGGKGGDRLKGSNGRDRLTGGKGKDRLKGGKGKDRLKAVDGKRDRAVNAGAGKDVCTIDHADLRVLKNCEKAKVRNRPGGPGKLRVTSATGLVCGNSLPTCQFEINGRRASATTGTVSGGGGVTNTAGGAVSTSGDAWTATGLYGCSDDGYLRVTIGARSVRVPITCTT